MNDGKLNVLDSLVSEQKKIQSNIGLVDRQGRIIRWRPSKKATSLFAEEEKTVFCCFKKKEMVETEHA